MGISLKPLKEQVVVITGASSGIGLTTARMAARRGAAVVAVARSGDALQELEREIIAAGGRALAVPADVSREADVARALDAAVERFGRIDTWVNDAAVAIYGRAEEVDMNDAHQLFEVNFWGMVYGSRAAVRHFKAAGGDGFGRTLINVGSTESDRALPLHSMYGASKHAVKGFTDVLRMELEEEKANVSVTLIKPGSINTPFTQHAKNHMANEPNYPPPVYAPEVVAEAILHAATHPVRDLFAGGGGKFISSAGQQMPRATDKLMEATLFRAQQQNAPSHAGHNLYEAGNDGLRERGNYPGRTRERSYYTQASMHPWLTGLLLGTAGAALLGALAAPRGRRRG